MPKMNIKKYIALDNPLRLIYHKLRAITANIYYNFPSKNMMVIWVTGTNGKTTTSNIIAQGLQKAGKKVFLFSTVNIIINGTEYRNDTKMTSPDAFELQRLLKVAKNEWCEIAVIETASHGIKMHRIWGIDYDMSVLTNITQDHLDLHRTMKDYVKTKLTIFKNLMTYNRKWSIKKTAIINKESNYADMFLGETYDSLYTYGNNCDASISYINLHSDADGMKFDVVIPWDNLHIQTSLMGTFNIYNIMAAIGVFISLWIEKLEITKIIAEITGVAGRMESVENNEWFNIYIDYAHTADAIEQVLSNVSDIPWEHKIITVFGATGDRDTTKRATMGSIVSRLSDVVILTQDDDYTENTEQIIKDVLPGIERKQWDDFWIIQNREEAIRTALVSAKKWDIIMILWKWDEHTMVTNEWIIPWHDKTIVQNILKWIDDNKILN